MRFTRLPTILGTAGILVAKLAVAQSATYDVRVQRTDRTPDIEYRVAETDGEQSAQPRPQRVQVYKARPGAAGGTVGLDVSPVPPAMAAQLRLRSRGAVVESVVPGGAAEQAGLQQYDVIEQIDGKNVENPEQLRQVISGRKPGDTVSFGIVREGKRRTIDVSIGPREQGSDAGQKMPKPTPFRISPPGMKSFQFSPADKQKLGQMSDKLHRDLEEQQRQIEAMAEKLKAQMEQMKVQIRQLRDQIKEEAKEQKKQALDKLKDGVDQLRDNEGRDQKR